MARTFKRQPFTVSTSANSYAKPQMFIQGEFKGISDIKNDVLADQSSFASADNVYVDDSMLLVSRAPFKFYDREAYIVKEWRFGAYQLRLYRLLTHDNSVIDKPGTYSESELKFTYLLKCISHKTTGNNKDTWEEMTWQIPVSDVGWKYEPDVTCADIEDKIFIWFAGFDLVAFNTTRLYFESGIKYLYLPIRSLVINGIETPLESENFLTPTGRRRYQYSALSSVNFEALVGKEMRVGLSGAATEGTSKHLYDATIQDGQDKVLIYPYAAIGNNYYIDVAQGLSTMVFLRYIEATGSIEVSFDGRYFEALPALTGILGLPQLTKDATHVVVFTTSGVAWCRLFADQSDEQAYAFTFTWDVKPYAELKDKYTVDGSFIPSGHFENEEQFAYIFRPKTLGKPVIYAEWPRGTLSHCWGYDVIDTSEFVNNDDIKVAEAYIAPTDEKAYSGLLVSTLWAQNADGKPAVMAHKFHATPDDDGYVDVEVSHRTFNNVSGTISGTIKNLALPCRHLDISVSTIDTTSVRVRVATVSELEDGTIFDYFVDMWYDTELGDFEGEKAYYLYPSRQSKYLRLEGNDILSDSYYCNGESGITQVVELPTIATNTFDEVLANNDAIELDGKAGNIHLIRQADSGVWNLTAGQIESGSLVAWKEGARTKGEYLIPSDIDMTTANATRGTFYYIERLSVQNGEWHVYDSGLINTGDIVRMRAYDETAYLYAGAAGNPVDRELEIIPWEYPAYDGPIPTEWPWSDYPKPWYPTSFGGYREWKPGDPLPTGPVTYYGVVNMARQIIPLLTNEQGIWLNIDGTLWTSQRSTENVLELDEYINTVRYDMADGTRLQTIDVKLHVPTHHQTLNEHYFSFEVDGRHVLQVTQTKRDEDKLLNNEDNDFLLYLPKRNEQVFTTKVTNLHPIADNILAVFTEQSIWNITISTLDDGSTVYSAPILSKIPSGCRDGDDVMTALDGQAVLIATPRGIAALAPQDFVATADNTMTYLSDNIQETYYRFYKDKVESTVRGDYDSNIKMLSYRYWLLFYRYMDRDILVFDTRTAAWWKWSAPYPIRQITSDIHLHLMLQIDYSLKHSFGGVSYVWKDNEDTEYNGTIDTLVELPNEIKSRKGYRDDVVENTLNGLSTSIYENEFIGTRKIVQYASPIIRWWFLSQKLHFNQINNYKAIKGITATLKGDDVLQTILSTKIYRSLYHPEQNDVIQTQINESRTFVQRLNLMHVVNFQYEFTYDASLEEPIPLRLCTLSIKYEVKEGIR